jgi:hypothetical protein
MSEEVIEAAEQAPVAAYLAFELIKERALFVHWNPRTEMHGDDPVPACDLKFELSAPNSILKKIRPGLIESFYEQDRQRDVEEDFMRKLKHPQIGPLAYDWEIPRVKLTIHDPDDDHSTVIMAGGRANKFKLTMLDGGTVKIQFRCQFSDYDEEVAPSLIRCNKQNVHISLSSAEEEVAGDNFQQVMDLDKQPDRMSDARKEAEKMFGAGSEVPAEVLAIEAAPEVADNVAPITGGRKRTKAVANSDIE